MTDLIFIGPTSDVKAVCLLEVTVIINTTIIYLMKKVRSMLIFSTHEKNTEHRAPGLVTK
jgi:hypothetical protein